MHFFPWKYSHLAYHDPSARISSHIGWIVWLDGFVSPGKSVKLTHPDR
jgi:hypothetical protein